MTLDPEDLQSYPEYDPASEPPPVDYNPYDLPLDLNLPVQLPEPGVPASQPAPASAPSYAPSGLTGGSFDQFGDYNPYTIPDLRNDAGGRKMEAALGMVSSLLGVPAGGGTPAPGSAGGAYRDDWAARPWNQGKNFDDTVIDPNRSGIDTSGMERGGLPVQRVISITGKELGSEPFSRWSDLRNVGGKPMYDAQGEVLRDESGRIRRYDLPGWNGQARFDTLNPTTLENGRQVLYDPFNNLTWGVGPDGSADRLLPGGRGYQGGASGGAYGYNPTTLNGRPVFYGEQDARTFERIGDRLGRNIASVAPAPARAAVRPGGAAGGGPTGVTTPAAVAPAAVAPAAPGAAGGEQAIGSYEGVTYSFNPATGEYIRRNTNTGKEDRTTNEALFKNDLAEIQKRIANQGVTPPPAPVTNTIIPPPFRGPRQEPEFDTPGGRIGGGAGGTAVGGGTATGGLYTVTANGDGTYTVTNNQNGTVFNGVSLEGLRQMGLRP